MKYGSVCSGIEAATAAWQPLGWQAAFFSEIDAFPRAVLAHHHPGVPLHGDFTTIQPGDYEPIDLLVGGTPCQSFSIAGLRGGLGDDRGNLALEYLRLADRLRPRWLVWENVPGVLSSNGGRDFGSILGGMVKLGYGIAYRVLDAQFFGVPQRRRRVFVVGYLGDWRRAAAVLFERESLSGHPAPSRKAGQGVAGTIAGSTGGSDENDAKDGRLIAASQPVARCDTARHGLRLDYETETFVTHSLRADGFDASEDGTGRGTPLVPVAFDTTQITSEANFSNPQPGDPCHPLAAGAHPPAIAFDCKASGRNGFGVGDHAPTLRAMGHADSHGNGGGQVAVAFQSSQSGVRTGEAHATLDSNNGSRRHNGVAIASAVRRLTPRECERLQGVADDFTLIPYGRPSKTKLDADFLKYLLRGNPKHLSRDDVDRLAKDGPRYKALGNSMAVPCMAWLGRRIQLVDAIVAANFTHERTNARRAA